MNQENIGAFIGKMRREKGMTQEQLAESLGVSQKSVSRWENGRTMPDLSLYEPLCQVLGIQVSELLYGKKLSDEEKSVYGEKSALNLLTTKSQLQTFAIYTEILIFIGVLISLTLSRFLTAMSAERIITLVSGLFVWGFGLVLRVKIREAIQKLEEQ